LLPKVLGSTAFCFLLDHKFSTLLMKISVPVWLQQATTLPVQFASTKQKALTGLPRSSGTSGSSSSFASLQNGSQSMPLQSALSSMPGSTERSFQMPIPWACAALQQQRKFPKGRHCIQVQHPSAEQRMTWLVAGLWLDRCFANLGVSSTKSEAKPSGCGIIISVVSVGNSTTM
jgi:hypothetical protein